MQNVVRAAAYAAVSVFSVAVMSGVPAQRASGATFTPAIIAPLTSEALPPVPAVEPSDAIVKPDQPVDQPIVADPIPNKPAIEAPAASLAALVSRHAAESAGGREADCLARAVYFESKGEPLAGRLAVAQVVMNRAGSGRFASSLCGVVKQPGQFSFVRGGAFPAVREKGQWREAVAIAHIAMNGLWTGPAAKAMYFHAKRVSPNWGKQRVAAVGNHIFYR